MGRSQESFHKKEVRNKKEKKRKEKEAKRLAKKEQQKSGKLEDMLAYVDENGVIVDTPPDPAKREKVKAEDIVIGVPKREALPEVDPIRNGVVTFFNHSKGFGFIEDTENGERVFAHVSNLIDEIDEGDKVIFEITMGPKGPNAVDVKRQ